MGFRLPPSGLWHQLCATGLCVMLALASITPAAHAADALNGKSLYLNGPPGGGASCASCHGPSPANNVNGILSGANNPSVISNAWAANEGGMGTLYNGKFTAAQIADLAAFLGNPNVTAAPTASLTPSSLTYGGTTVGQASGALGVTLSNTGSAVLNIGTIGITGSAAGDYSITGGSCAAGGTVAAGASCSVLVAFKPSATGTRAAALNISHNATGGNSTVSLSGTGNALPQATIGVSATNVNFGGVLTNVPSATQTITVSNSGQAPLALAGITLGGPNAGVFTLGGSCSTQAPVAAGASCTLTVQALPTAAGAFSASITLSSNAANGNVTIALAGSGAAAAPALAAHPGMLAFGSQTVGAGPVTQNVTLSNTGNVALNFTSVSVSGAGSIALGANSCNGTLAVGAGCTVAVVFTPTAPGNVTATLLARSNAADLQVAISGAGTTAGVAKPTLSESGPIAFADTQVGNSTSAHTITLSNPGGAALKIAGLVLDGAQAGDFVLGGTCSVNGTLSPGANCTIDTAFKPSAAGARGADLLLMTDGGTQFVLHLAGNGIAIAASHPSLAIAPQSFDFGAATVGATAPTKRFALSNSGTAALSLASVAFSGPFSRADDTTGCPALPFALQPGASCDLVVRYVPTAAGAVTGSVQIQGDTGASWTIALTGTASVPAPATVSNRGGGGCSAARDGNDPVLALLVVLALGVIGWRRRQARRTA